MSQSNEVVIVFPLSILAHRTRLVKLASIATELGLSLSTWSWERNKGEFDDELPLKLVDRKILLRGGGYNSKWIKFYYPLWVSVVFLNLMFHRPKRPIYCLGFETAFPAWLASKIIGVEYIFDDADRFSLLIKMPKIINRWVRKLEQKVSEDSLVNIIPGLERYEFQNKKQHVLKNTPDSTTLDLSQSVEVERPDANLVIFVNGWMGETRGLPIALKLAQRLIAKKQHIKFVAAGRLSGASAEQFVKLPTVTYLGSVESYEALAWYRAVDLVFTYYDPSVQINRYAESNKWGDSLVFDVPAIVNDEVMTADFLRKENACVSTPYSDIDLLEQKIIQLSESLDELNTLKVNLRNLNSNIVFFDTGMKTILRKVYYEETI